MSAQAIVSDAWRDLVRRLGRDATSAESTLESLKLAYAEPHRHYHTLDHIADLLRLLEEHGGSSDTDAIKLAILFHDAVYDPRRRDNEIASAALAVARLSTLKMAGDIIAKVKRYILATQHDAPIPADPDPDLCLLLDIDLSVLAAAPERYGAYALAIRQEYADIPDDAYRAGRRSVLEGFIARRSIYRTPRLTALWEARARANMTAEIAQLADAGAGQGQTCT